MFSYFITPNLRAISNWQERLDSTLKHFCPDFVCLRESLDFCSASALEFLTIAKNNNVKAAINTDFLESFLDSAISKFDAIHLKEKYLDSISTFKKFEKKIILSTHSLESAIKAINSGADFITLSPIFKTKNYADSALLGIKFLASLPQNIKQKTIALGGINTSEKIDLIAKTNIAGFASISYFWDAQIL